MNKKAIVNKIIKFSNVDGPGNRMTIFFQGCNFDCGYCHNPETLVVCENCGSCIEYCPTNALKKVENKVVFDSKTCIDCDMCIRHCSLNSSPKCKKYSVEELLLEVNKLKSFIKGVTVSGGECTLQHHFITKFFKEIKKKWKDLTCFVDTNGSLNLWEKEYSEFIAVTDFFMLDIKNWDNKEHIELTKKSNESVLKNLIFLKQIDKLYEVRTVIYNSNEQNRETVINISKQILNSDIRYKLIGYRDIGVREENKNLFIIPTKEELEELKSLALINGLKESQLILI